MVRKAQTGPQPELEVATKSDDHATEAASRFDQAIDDAKAGVDSLSKEAQARAKAYREELEVKSQAWREEARSYGEQAKSKASDLADQGKAKASEALAGVGELIADTAPVIDEKIGQKYGDYARSAASQIRETASSLETRSFDELGEDAKTFVRKSPGMALGMAAVAGFMLSRLFGGKK